MIYLYKVLFFIIFVGCTTITPTSKKIHKNRGPKKIKVKKVPKCSSSNWPVVKTYDNNDRFNVFWNLDLPVVGLISSYYGVRRGKCHYGIDIHTTLGSKIKAVYGGIIKFSGKLGS